MIAYGSSGRAVAEATKIHAVPYSDAAQHGGGLAQPDAKFLSDVVGEVFTYFSGSAAATRKLWGSRNVDMYLMRVLYIHCLHGSEVYYVSFT